MWNSQTYGKLNLNEIPEKLFLFYEANKQYGESIEIAIGTDSQNHNFGTKNSHSHFYYLQKAWWHILP